MKRSLFWCAVVTLALASAASYGKPFRIAVPNGPSSKVKASLPAGGTLEVYLVSNPSTGYSWKVAAGNPEVLKQVGEPTYRPPAKPMPGAGGTQVFTFKALKPGAAKLTFRYARSWEKGVPPVKTAQVTVNVARSGNERTRR